MIDTYEASVNLDVDVELLRIEDANREIEAVEGFLRIEEKPEIFGVEGVFKVRLEDEEDVDRELLGEEEPLLLKVAEGVLEMATADEAARTSDAKIPSFISSGAEAKAGECVVEREKKGRKRWGSESAKSKWWR
ncbi:hypothetical protein P7C70_g8025, partial [Phenoliferia sp. Uapishka_3]